MKKRESISQSRGKKLKAASAQLQETHTVAPSVPEQNTQPLELSGQFYDNADVMRLLNISYSTLLRMRNNGQISYTTIGKRVLYPKEFFTKGMLKNLKNGHLLQ